MVLRVYVAVLLDGLQVVSTEICDDTTVLSTG